MNKTLDRDGSASEDATYSPFALSFGISCEVCVVAAVFNGQLGREYRASSRSDSGRQACGGLTAVQGEIACLGYEVVRSEDRRLWSPGQ